jgi:DNA-directed RNA polymerase subunit RPC12/RpoP
LLLKKCPECGSEIENDIFRDYQYCPVCGVLDEKRNPKT